MYEVTQDPWSFATSAYELDKYDTTMSSLGAFHYRRCFEPACSIGVLTQLLAARADGVVACDGSAVAIERARTRLSAAPHVELVAAAIPEWWPPGSFDLIVLSELGYYWDIDGWGEVIERCRASLVPGGEVMAVHWLGAAPDHVLDGETVHRELTKRLGESDLHIERGAEAGTGFVLDRWKRVPRG